MLAAPKAVIDFDRVCIVDSLTYTDASFIPLNSSGATIDAYRWSYGEFGNTNDGVTRNPKYKYTDHGNKTVGLTVTTSQGCSHDTTKVIRVGPLPDVDFTWSKVCSGLEVTEFRDATSTIGNYSAISEYEWNFGDGDVLGLVRKIKTFLRPRMVAVQRGHIQTRTMTTIRSPHSTFNSPSTRKMDVTEQNKTMLLSWIM